MDTPASHLRFAGQSDPAQRVALETIVRADPLLMQVLKRLRALDLPDWLLVSGAIYNQVWNVLTGRAALTGVKDVDVFYFDADKLDYGSEDRVIRAAAPLWADLPVPVEIRNQARVHLWFEKKFGTPFAPLNSSAQMLERFASRTHAVGVRLEADDSMTIVAPFGLDDMFSFRIVPNHVLDNRGAHEQKSARAQTVWPELVVEPW